MDWEMQGCKVVHKSGFSVSVDEGSFAFPYDISYAGAAKLSPVMLALMIRAGLQYGRRCERENRNPPPASTPRAPVITYKRSRSYIRR